MSAKPTPPQTFVMIAGRKVNDPAWLAGLKIAQYQGKLRTWELEQLEGQFVASNSQAQRNIYLTVGIGVTVLFAALIIR